VTVQAMQAMGIASTNNQTICVLNVIYTKYATALKCLKTPLNHSPSLFFFGQRREAFSKRYLLISRGQLQRLVGIYYATRAAKLVE
jgi:hypothetical protein